MEWKKRGNAKDYEQFIIERTGRHMTEFMDVNKSYRVDRMKEVAEVLLRAKESQELVTVVGDYDADGINAMAIMAIICILLKLRYSLIIPKRFSEGYGLNSKIIDRIAPGGVLITIDNGIVANDSIQKAKEKGMTVIVMDHHIGSGTLPTADIIIDPMEIEQSADYPYYCGAGLGFKLAECLFGQEHPMVKMMSVYAAIATIGDAVPLTGDNRKIVLNGMSEMRCGNMMKGMKKLLKACKIDVLFSAEDLAYYVVPCINAPGRLQDDGGILALNTILCNDKKAEELVGRLVETNQQRKSIVETILEKVDIETMKRDGSKFIFYYNESLPEGLAGLLAGKFAEETGKPSFCLCKTADGYVKGSCRSKYASVHLKKILDCCSDMLIKYGGHEKAAALALEEQKLEELKTRLDTFMPDFVPEDALYYDFEIQAKELMALSDKMDMMEPFGEGNPCPIICIKNIRIGDNYGNKFAYVGIENKHVRLNFMSFKAIGFHMAEKMKECEGAEFFDLLGKVEKNYYNHKVYYQMRLLDFRPSIRK